MRSVLITGGSGAFGTALCNRLLRDSDAMRVVVFSRSEHRQADLARELGVWPTASWRMRYFIGDVRDRDRLRRAMDGIDVVIHAAALKRIEVGNYNPLEVKKTNIDGAANVIEAATDAGVGRVIALSTDKAYQPISPYGTSKAFAESLFTAANNTRGNNGPWFSIVRYGNVWNSTGSVVPTWRAIIAKGFDNLGQGGWSTVPVTNPECTRFFMRMDEAVDLVLMAARPFDGAEFVIPQLPAYRLGDLAEAMGVQMDIRGLPSWEKLHESMGPGNCSETARRMTVQELKEALLW